MKIRQTVQHWLFPTQKQDIHTRSCPKTRFASASKERKEVRREVLWRYFKASFSEDSSKLGHISAKRALQVVMHKSSRTSIGNKTNLEIPEIDCLSLVIFVTKFLNNEERQHKYLWQCSVFVPFLFIIDRHQVKNGLFLSWPKHRMFGWEGLHHLQKLCLEKQECGGL